MSSRVTIWLDNLFLCQITIGFISVLSEVRSRKLEGFFCSLTNCHLFLLVDKADKAYDVCSHRKHHVCTVVLFLGMKPYCISLIFI